MKKKARKQRGETRQATAELCRIAVQVEQLAARRAEAISQSQLVAVCNNICNLVVQPGLRMNEEQLSLLGQLQLPLLLAKLLVSARQLLLLSLRDESASSASLEAYYKLNPVLRASIAVLGTAMFWEGQDGGAARQLLCCNTADRIMSCGVLAIITASMQDLAVTLPKCQRDHPMHITDMPFLHLIWWLNADTVCTVADRGCAVAACAPAAAQLVLPVIKALGAPAAAASRANHCLLLLKLCDRLMQYQQYFPTGAPNQDTQQLLQQQSCKPALLQVAVVQLVLRSRRLCTRAAGRAGGSSSRMAAASTAAAAAVEGLPVAAQALLPILQVHQRQLWLSLGLSADSLAGFDAAAAEDGRPSTDDAARFMEAAVAAQQEMGSLMCQNEVAITPEQLQQLPLLQKQLLQAVMWDLPVVLLGTAACFLGLGTAGSFLEHDPRPLPLIANACEALLFCWQFSSESAPSAAAATTGGAAVSAPDPAVCSADTAAQQQDSNLQHQQALTHLLQCWLALMQQQLLQQQQQHSGPVVQQLGESSGSSSSSYESSSGDSASSGATQRKLVLYKWDMVERLLHAMYHAAMFLPGASAAWHTHAARLAMTLELFLRAMLSPALTSDHGRQEHNAADNCCEKQQQQQAKQSEQLQQPAGQQHQQHTSEDVSDSTRSECVAAMMQTYMSCAGTLLFSSKASIPGPLLQAALSEAAASSSSSSSQQVASLLVSYFKLLPWSPESCCSQSDLTALADAAHTSRCIVEYLIEQPHTDSLAQLVAPWLVLQGRCMITLSAYIKQAASYTSGAIGGGSTSGSGSSSSSSSCRSDQDVGIDGNGGSSGDSGIVNRIDCVHSCCSFAADLVHHLRHALLLYLLQHVFQWQQTGQPPLRQQHHSQQQQQQQKVGTLSARDVPQAHMAANAGAAVCGPTDAAACCPAPKDPLGHAQSHLGRLPVPAAFAASLAKAALNAAKQFIDDDDSSSNSSSSSSSVGGMEDQHGACCDSQGDEESSTSSSSSHTCLGGSSSRSSSSGSSTDDDEAVAAKLLGADAVALQAARSPSECLSVLLQSSCMQALTQLLQDAGAALCAAFPVPCMCNNPGCRNMACSSELLLVGGKGSVCGGCKVARYCGRACQSAHWKQHRPVCRYLAAQQGCQETGQGAAS